MARSIEWSTSPRSRFASQPFTSLTNMHEPQSPWSSEILESGNRCPSADFRVSLVTRMKSAVCIQLFTPMRRHQSNNFKWLAREPNVRPFAGPSPTPCAIRRGLYIPAAPNPNSNAILIPARVHAWSLPHSVCFAAVKSKAMQERLPRLKVS